jgi:hypothetical protein
MNGFPNKCKQLTVASARNPSERTNVEHGASSNTGKRQTSLPRALLPSVRCVRFGGRHSPGAVLRRSPSSPGSLVRRSIAGKTISTRNRCRRTGPPRGRRASRAFRKPIRGLVPALKSLVEPGTLGDPMRPLTWVSKSLEKLAAALTEMANHDTVRKRQASKAREAELGRPA